MTKRMLIDATHAEETRVAVVDGTRLMEFDYESKVRRQLKGTIFLAKVTRVEPSLQAAFVNFGGNRHGFLPFSEIHPDYYRIPIADREALLAEQRADMEAREAEERAAEEEEERAQALGETKGSDDSAEEDDEEEDIVVELGGEKPLSEEDEVETEANAVAEATADISEDDQDEDAEEEPEADSARPSVEVESDDFAEDDAGDEPVGGVESFEASPVDDLDTEEETFGNRIPVEGEGEVDADGNTLSSQGTADDANRSRSRGGRSRGGRGGRGGERGGERSGERTGGGDRNRGGRGRGRGGPRHSGASSRRVEVLGGDGIDGDRPTRPTSRRHYKIQEVIKRGQIMLIQASKEERGNKGAAVTSFLSLPGRYCVLMPNSPRGGGVSRKIANFVERKRMREILSELSVPDGMSVIMRTAGMSRTKVEIKRDLDYLLRLWDDVRELTLKSTAPALIHEEGNLIRRAVRDLYGSDIEEIVVSGDEGFKAARDFMKVMMPSHAKRVIQYKDEQLPLFQRYKVEGQIREMGDPTVVLKSGGYLVINPTEALVSIDVNSGRATRERHIEETALKTNMEAAEEVARQLRLRDLGGLVVIDFIDMEDRRNNAKVERKLRDSLAGDRARIQMGRISSFGLMEMSRQRLNPSLTEAQFEKCPHCLGIGVIRTVDNCAILALRGLEEEGMRARAAELHLSLPNAVAIYILNNKREMLADIERRYDVRVLIRADDSLHTALFKIDVVRNVDTDSDDEEGDSPSGEAADSGDGGGSRSRGGRGGRGRNRSRDGQGGESAPSENTESEDSENGHETADESSADDAPQGERTESAESSGERGTRRRGRRGGRGRNGGDRNGMGERPERGDRPDRGGRGDRPYEPRGPRTTRHDGGTVDGTAASDDVAAQSSQPAPQRSGGVEPVFYGRRRASSSGETPSSGGGNDSAANDAPADSASESGEKKKGWWNRLVE